MIVPRYKHSAVDRNRLKRRLRELARLRLLPVLSAQPAADVVLRVFPPAYRATFAQLTGEVERAVRQLARGLPPLRVAATVPLTPATTVAPPSATPPPGQTAAEER